MSSELSVKQKFRIGQYMLLLLCFLRFCIFFTNPKKRDFLRFFAVFPVLSRTMLQLVSRDPDGLQVRTIRQRWLDE